MYQRGGKVLKTGKIGRVNCLHQQFVRPGETIDIRWSGKVFMESLRERESVGMDVQLHHFYTPLRWLWPEFPDYLRDGPETSATYPTESLKYAQYGIGSRITALAAPRFFKDNVLRIYNEHYKWPEDADATSWSDDGNKAVPLEAVWSRCRDQGAPQNSEDQTVNSSSTFDVQELSQVQARFRSAMEREVLSFERYREMIKEMFGTDTSREVDQVPLLFDSTDGQVDPKELAAHDGASLGQYMSIYDFELNHEPGAFTAPEHGVICAMLVVRFNSVSQYDANPFALASGGVIDWVNFVGDPGLLAAAPPEQVQVRDILALPSTNNMGFLPSGWRQRAGWNVIGERVSSRNSFPIYNDITLPAHGRDATRVENAFVSQSLGDYRCNLRVSHMSDAVTPSARSSYNLGTGDAGKGSTKEFIVPGVR